MKVFLDTNVLIAAFITRGACAELFEHCLAVHEIHVSRSVLRELLRNLVGKFGFSNNAANHVVRFIRANATVCPDILPETTICRDLSDDTIIASAAAAEVACLVTGDGDIRVLQDYGGVRFLRPSEFWRFEKENRQ